MRILIVTMADSIHMARWINQLSGQGWDVHLFGVSDARPHPDLRNVTVHSFSSGKYAGAHDSVRIASIWPVPRGCGALVKVAEKLKPSLIDRAQWLARVIRKIQPDIVHSQEIQHGAYLTMAARKLLGGRFPIWIVSNWGSDIFLFGRLAAHVERIKEVLQHCDFYACECHRDIALARDLGFRGQVLPVLPIGGGFDLDQIAGLRSPGPSSSRPLVVLKGNQHFAGRALIGVSALRLCAGKLRNRRVAIYNARPEVVMAGELLAKETGLHVDIVPPCSHEDMLRLFGQARIYLGLSISDGISTSLLEALAMGAFPIQSWTACADEWIQDGANGLLVPPEDPYAVASALRQALKDDDLVDEAADINANVCAERLDQRLIRTNIIDFYRRVATGHVGEPDYKTRCGCESPLLDGHGWNRRTTPCVACKKALTASRVLGAREKRSCVS